MRTISEPAAASAATCCTVPAISAVSVLVIDCTTTGAPPPTFTWPTFTATVLRLGNGAAASIMAVSLAPQRSARQAIWRQFGYSQAVSTVPERHGGHSLAQCEQVPLISITDILVEKPALRAATASVWPTAPAG